MAGVLDYFFIGPGEKKRNQAEIDKFSQQLNLDTEQKVKLMEAERLARNKVRDEEEARMMESLTRLNAQNDELMPGEGAAMTSAIAQKRMDEMRTAKGLAESSGNMNIFAQNQAARPMMGRLGETSALAGIGENEAGIAKNELSKRDAIARQARITEEAMADQNARIAQRLADIDTTAMGQRLIPKQEMSLGSGYDANTLANSLNKTYYTEQLPRVSEEVESGHSYKMTLNALNALKAAKESERLKAIDASLQGQTDNELLRAAGSQAATQVMEADLQRRKISGQQHNAALESRTEQDARIRRNQLLGEEASSALRTLPNEEIARLSGADAQSMRNIGNIQQAYYTDWTDIGKSLGDQARATSAVSREVVKRPDQSRTFYHAPPPRAGAPKVLSPVDMQMLAQMGLDPAMVQQMMLGNQTSAIPGRNAVPQAVSMPNPSANKGAKEGAVGNLFK